MGSFAPKGHATVDPQAPAAFAICECCGFQYNHRDLAWNMQWHGRELRSTGHLHCPTCLDVPNPQLRPFVLPPDPVPILNPRAERTHVHVPHGDMVIGAEPGAMDVGVAFLQVHGEIAAVETASDTAAFED
jgi:hypothetical protein